MNKKLIVSLAIMAIAGAAAIGGTMAYFSDTETSKGNTFTAGSLDLTVDSQCTYNGVTSTQCGNWVLKNLDPTADKFFNFTDVKPGDQGENTISLHVDNNDAYGCFYVSPLANNDNSCTSPECIAENPVGTDCSNPAGKCGTDPGAGELAQNIQFFAWADNGAGSNAGNNVWDSDELPVFTNISGPASDVLSGKTYPLGTLPGGSTKYIGLQWCAGAMTVDTSTRTITCDGSAMGNNAQTDSMAADIAFSVTQTRNNPNFVCPPSPFTGAPTQGPIVGAKLSAYVAPTTCNVNVPNNSDITTINQGILAAQPGQTVCVAAGTYNEDVVINKSITLAGAGAATTIINGQTTGQGAAVTIAANNVTVEGFAINGAGIAALWLNTGVSGANVQDDHMTSASGETALTTQGQQSNDLFTNNQFTGNGASQVAYVNGEASLGAGQASSNVDFTQNTFDGIIVAGGEALGNESTNSNTNLNAFKSTLTSTYAITEAWKADAIFSQNNFDGVGGVKVKNSASSGTVDAQNNWWGAAVPSGNTAGSVDDSSKAGSAFTEN